MEGATFRRWHNLTSAHMACLLIKRFGVRLYYTFRDRCIVRGRCVGRGMENARYARHPRALSLTLWNGHELKV